jgi:hypothetical protein
MGQIFNVYCDESCHLERDGHKVMVLGAVWCPLEKAKEISLRIREIKARHGLGRHAEVKWTRVSPSKHQMYLDLIDYFFDDDDLLFRGLLVSDKEKLHHRAFGQTHDEWYYKMYFFMLAFILSPKERYRIYLDIKDTRGGERVRQLHDVLSNSKYDFSRQIIQWIQIVRSHEVEMFQLADLLIGAISYANRHIETSATKLAIVERIRSRSGYGLTRNTLMREKKLNLLRWEPSEVTPL